MHVHKDTRWHNLVQGRCVKMWVASYDACTAHEDTRWHNLVQGMCVKMWVA